MKAIETENIDKVLTWINENKTQIIEISIYNDLEDITNSGENWRSVKPTGKKTITIEMDMRKTNG